MLDINPKIKLLVRQANSTKSMILPNGTLVSLDTKKTRLNNNVVCIGGSGTGKTCSLVVPNLAAAVDSYILSDPKGSLHKQYGAYLKQNGYTVAHIDFIHPEQSDGYNPLDYVRNNDDIQKLSHHIIFSGNYSKPNISDPFWTQSSELMLNMAIAYLVEQKNFHEIFQESARFFRKLMLMLSNGARNVNLMKFLNRWHVQILQLKILV